MSDDLVLRLATAVGAMLFIAGTAAMIFAAYLFARAAVRYWRDPASK